MVAGHVLECGTQATGGNYSFFTELADPVRPGFPIAELSADGSCVITKHPGTGGAVTVGTVTAQLLYEIAGPRYPGPDVTSRFDTVRLRQAGPDRVAISGVVGEPPPPSYKVCLSSLGGFRNEVAFVLTGLDIEAKAELVRRQLADVVADLDAEWTLARTDHPDADTEQAASATLHCVLRSAEPDRIGRRFSDAAVQLALGSYPGFHLAAPPSEARPYGVMADGYLPVSAVCQQAVLPDGSSRQVPPVGSYREVAELAEPIPPEYRSGGPTRRLPLGTVLGARSGDKAGSANLGVWAREPRMFGWLAATLTEQVLRELLPELAELPIRRYLLPNLDAVNFVIDGLLGQGVGYQARFDPQAKGLAEWLRSRTFDIPEEFLP
ncbi:MAG TPA: acyclic terpene utilization AtuA family protein [Jatrophihabitans sp.]|nr:acyclic terpene utilization AtuA family protein [Jatrophihabitans sp.]